MLNFHLKIFKTLMLNFAYIYSKRRKLVMFILFQTWQFFYPKNQIRHQFAKFLHFQFLVTWHVTWSCHVKAQENLKICFWGKNHLVLGLLAIDIANHSYPQNTSLTQALKPLSYPIWISTYKKHLEMVVWFPDFNTEVNGV